MLRRPPAIWPQAMLQKRVNDIGIACWRKKKKLTFEAFGRGYDVKDQGQNAEAYTDRRDVVITVLCGHTLAVHALAQ